MPPEETSTPAHPAARAPRGAGHRATGSCDRLDRDKGSRLPTCSNLGVSIPGIHNSWPRWSPETTTVDGKTYYWVIFSSSRDGYTLHKDANKKASQLYVTGVVVEGTTVRTYPSIYLWNQTTGTSNHTPAWDVFKIPPAPVPL
ncbi:hypothetical protein WME75_44725 [Sorangium sp. So ce1014]|uniref:hypothetical protein n=1 Tax=Sorangium sp. So ce1014 TaxID=3133326 RepID=UPI003F606F6C